MLSKLSQASLVKNVHHSNEWKVVSVANQVKGGFRGTPKGGVPPPINLEVFFSDILATASRLNTLYGLET